ALREGSGAAEDEQARFFELLPHVERRDRGRGRGAAVCDRVRFCHGGPLDYPRTRGGATAASAPETAAMTRRCASGLVSRTRGFPPPVTPVGDWLEAASMR